MKLLRGLLLFVLVTAFATGNAVANRGMMLQRNSSSHFTKDRMKSFLEDFCCERYEDCFPERQYMNGSLAITSFKKLKTKYEISGTHSYKGKAILGLRNSYKDIRFKAFVTPQKHFIKVEFHKWYVPNLPGKDGHWEIAVEYVPIGKPKVALVLGGGGAKGAATIGALKVIHKTGIKVDYVVGTSIGSVIGGLYAAGYSPNEIESLFLNNEWLRLLTDKPAKKDKSRNAIGVTKGDVVQKKLDALFKKKKCRTFKSTRIPFRCVTTDVVRIKEVILSNDSLAKAIRASISIPGVYRPVEIGDLQLIDGGLMNNLPVDVARRMGASIVIAIDLEQNNKESKDIWQQLKEKFSIQGITDLIGSNAQKHAANVKDADVYIHPNLSGFDIYSFGTNNFKTMEEVGEETARKKWNELIKAKKRIQGKK